MSATSLGGLVWELRSTDSIPSVPFADGIDAASFGDDAFFVTLPLVEVGKQSDNGVLWDNAAADRLVAQINQKRPEGILGHVPKSERDHRFDLPPIRWVGAKRVKDNRVWGKAYVSPQRTDVRDYFETAMKAKARVGTSVYGLKGKRGLHDLELETIDIGHPDRVANRASAAIPVITQELQTDNGDAQMDELIQELRGQRDELKTTIKDLQTENQQLVTEMTALKAKRESSVEVLAELRKVDGISEDTNIVKFVNDIVSELSQKRVEAAAALRSKLVAELVELEEIRPTIEARLTNAATDKDTITAEIAELLKAKDVEAISELVVRAKSGGRVIRKSNDKPNGNHDVDDSPEALAAAAKAIGIGLPS